MAIFYCSAEECGPQAGESWVIGRLEQNIECPYFDYDCDCDDENENKDEIDILAEAERDVQGTVVTAKLHHLNLHRHRQTASFFQLVSRCSLTVVRKNNRVWVH